MSTCCQMLVFTRNCESMIIHTNKVNKQMIPVALGFWGLVIMAIISPCTSPLGAGTVLQTVLQPQLVDETQIKLRRVSEKQKRRDVAVCVEHSSSTRD